MTDIEGQARLETPQEKAEFDAMTGLVEGSIPMAREYCRFMVGVASGFVPAFAAVLGIGSSPLEDDSIVLIAVGSAAFLLSASVFAAGCLPIKEEISLDEVDSLREKYASMLGRRRSHIIWGFTAFVVGNLLSMAAVITSLS